MVDNGQLLIRSSGARGFPGRTGYLETSYKQLDCAGLVCVKCGAPVRTESSPSFLPVGGPLAAHVAGWCPSFLMAEWSDSSTVGIMKDVVEVIRGYSGPSQSECT